MPSDPDPRVAEMLEAVERRIEEQARKIEKDIGEVAEIARVEMYGLVAARRLAEEAQPTRMQRVVAAVKHIPHRLASRGKPLETKESDPRLPAPGDAPDSQD